MSTNTIASLTTISLILLCGASLANAACVYGIREGVDGPQAAMSNEGTISYCRLVPELSNHSRETFACVREGQNVGLLVAPVVKKGWLLKKYGKASFSTPDREPVDCDLNG